MDIRHIPVDTGRKLNVHKTFRRRPEDCVLIYLEPLWDHSPTYLFNKLIWNVSNHATKIQILLDQQFDSDLEYVTQLEKEALWCNIIKSVSGLEFYLSCFSCREFCGTPCLVFFKIFIKPLKLRNLFLILIERRVSKN